MIENDLQQLGFSEKEQQIYLALLKMGPSAVIPIAKKAGIGRTMAYFVLDSLMQKGVVTSIEKGGKKYFAVEQPHKLLDLLETEEQIVKRNLNQLIDRKKRIRQIMPELISMASTGSQPKVRFFEGKEGVISAFEDTLKQPAGSEILMYSTTRGFYSEVPSYLDSYLKKRVARKISVRLILPDDPLSIEYAKKDKDQLRQTRLVPAAKFPFTNEIDIYDDKLAIVSLEEEWLAVIIESESIAKTQKLIFELAWDGANVDQVSSEGSSKPN